MNYKMVGFVLGRIFLIEAALMLFPMGCAAIYGEWSVVLSFLWPTLIVLVLGLITSLRTPQNTKIYARDGLAIVALVWVLMSVFGALPFVISGEIPSFADAFFETVSGFTTTGSTILTDVEALSHGTLFWRSFSHWIGGMGILVFILSILPMTGDYNMHIMRAESPGPSVGKLVPKIRITAKLLYQIYFFMTIATMGFLLIGGMPVFDTICMSLGAAGTGGFACRNSGQADYTLYQQAVLSIAMILFGVNFNVYYLLLIKKPKDAFRCEEMRGYLAVILGAVILITLNVRHLFPSLFLAVHHVLFQVASIITTTGYATVDFNQWPEFSKCIVLLLMFIGACAGSTGGGIKVSRIMMAFKEAKKEMATVIHPRSVKVIKYEGKVLGHPVLRSLNAYLILYALIFAVSVLLVSLDNFDFATSFSAVAANFNNIGPGLSTVGPSSNFSMLSDLSKLVLIFDMLAGRLELFPILVLFSPGTWKKG